MADERVERLAQQLYAEGYVPSEDEALLAAQEVIAASDAMPAPADGGAAKPAAAQRQEHQRPTPT
jgi:hypothetical protein